MFSKLQTYLLIGLLVLFAIASGYIALQKSWLDQAEAEKETIQTKLDQAEDLNRKNAEEMSQWQAEALRARIAVENHLERTKKIQAEYAKLVSEIADAPPPSFPVLPPQPEGNPPSSSFDFSAAWADLNPALNRALDGLSKRRTAAADRAASGEDHRAAGAAKLQGRARSAKKAKR